MSDSDEKEDRTVIVTTKVELPEKATSLEPYLIPVGGRESEKAFKLKGNTLKIGREPFCEIFIDDPHVSRVHAEITCLDETNILIRDLSSTNGIFINGKKVKEQILKDNDKILIGTRSYFKVAYRDSDDQDYQQKLFRSANVDTLTGLYNRKYFNDALSRDFSFCKRTNEPLSLMMFDIDHFKKINDTFGHLGGDTVLTAIGNLLIKNLRLENVACRYGGEEFGVILRNVKSEQALPIAERIRKTIEAEKVIFKEKEIRVTISIGIATLEGKNFTTYEDLIHSADELLYEAKELGRNRTVIKQAA